MSDYLEKKQKMGFTRAQLREVEKGTKTLPTDKIDIYADPKYDNLQMQQIRLALEHGLSQEELAVFLNPAIPWESMQHAREKIEKTNLVDERAKAKLHAQRLKSGLWLALSLVCIAVLVGGGYFGKWYYERVNQNLFITLVKDDITLEYGKAFNAQTYLKSYTKANNVRLILPTSIDTKAIGKVKVTYEVKNEVKAYQKDLTIHIVDTESPKIVLTTTDITLTRGEDSFEPLSYVKSATDNVDGDVISKITPSALDESLNEQTITYEVTDGQGNKSSAELQVHLIDPKPIATPEPIIIYQPALNTPSQSTINNNPAPVQPVTHGSESFLFENGYDMDSAYAACVAKGNSYGSYSCTPIMGADGLYKGYTLTY